MAEMKFEEALKKLEEMVEAIENGELTLDESLSKYEEGIRLSKLCAKKLEDAKKKVEILIKSEDGTYDLKPFDELETETAPKKEMKKKKPAKEEDGLFK